MSVPVSSAWDSRLDMLGFCLGTPCLPPPPFPRVQCGIRQLSISAHSSRQLSSQAMPRKEPTPTRICLCLASEALAADMQPNPQGAQPPHIQLKPKPPAPSQLPDRPRGQACQAPPASQQPVGDGELSLTATRLAYLSRASLREMSPGSCRAGTGVLITWNFCRTSAGLPR